MHIKQLHPDEIKELYQNHMKRDFPITELRPLKDILRLNKKEIYHCFGYFNNQEIVAYACLVQDSEIPQGLLDYFAVVPEKRQGGIGGQFFKELTHTVNCDGILIEVETPEAAKSLEEEMIRKRRIAFYERNGANLTPISGPLFSVHFTIMQLPIKKTQINHQKTFENLIAIYKKMLPVPLIKRFVRFKLNET